MRGIMTSNHWGVQDAPLDRDAIEALVTSDECGAVITFVGRVRNHDPEVEGTVVTLEYSAHPDAQQILGELVTELASQSARELGVELHIAAFHRIGRLEVGDAALIVSVAAAHRANTFEVSRELVERIKARVPIWKKQFTASGEAAWVGIS